MTNNLTEQEFAVGVSRLNAGFAAAVLCGLTGFMVFLFTNAKGIEGLLGSLLLVMLLLTAPIVSLACRRRPLYVIDRRGITDNGYFGRGFGLIEWRNIEGIRTYSARGVYLMIKVNNFDELLDRRNLLIRPLIWLNCRLCAMLGGEINLSISYADAPLPVVLEKITAYSNQNIAVGQRNVMLPPRSMGEEFRARLSVTVVVLLLFAAAAPLAMNAYQLWLRHRAPQLEILGGTEDFPMNISLGKCVSLQGYTIENFGEGSTGIQVEVSGRAFDTGFLKKPQILVDFENEKQDDANYFVKHTREVVPLQQVGKNTWVGVSKRAFLPHKDDMFAESWQIFSDKYTSAIGWWTNPVRPSMTIGLFATVPKNGNGRVCLKVSALGHANSVVSQTTLMKTSTRVSNNQEICSVGVPKDYPISQYPGSTILWLSRPELKLDSTAKPSGVASYYIDELKRKGWNVSQRENRMKELVVEGRKGHDQVEIRIEQIPKHTPVWVTFNYF